MKKHAIIFASLALSCLVLSAPLSAGAVSSSQRPCHGTGPRQGSHQCIHHTGRNADLHRNGHFRNWQSHAGCRRSFAAQHRQPAGPDPHCGCTGTFRCGTAMDKL